MRNIEEEKKKYPNERYFCSKCGTENYGLAYWCIKCGDFPGTKRSKPKKSPTPKVIPKPMGKCNPVLYSTFYPMLVEVAHKYGYALAIHGSMIRDLDLIAVAWISRPKSYKKMIKEMIKTVGWKTLGLDVTTHSKKPNGRLAYTIPVGAGLYIDLSIIPPK